MMKDATAKRSTGAGLGQATCPICGKPSLERWRPFCSKRCADVDLHRWLSGAYAIPVAPEADEDGERLPEGAADRDEPERD